MKRPDDELDELLDGWRTEFASDPRLAGEVSRRLEGAVDPGRGWDWLQALASRPAFAGLAAAALIAAGIGIAQLWQTAGPSEAEYLGLYRLSIDPVLRLEASAVQERRASERALASGVPLEASLSWLEGELRMDAAQTERFSSLHRSYRETFDSLFVELVALRRGYDAFDAKRKTDDVVDFLALYDLLQKQKALQARSGQLTEELLRRASEILDTSQQARFAELILRRSDGDPKAPPSTNA